MSIFLYLCKISFGIVLTFKGDSLRLMSITFGCEIRPYLTTTDLSSDEFSINGTDVTTSDGIEDLKELAITKEIVYYAVATSTTNWNVSTGTRLVPDAII